VRPLLTFLMLVCFAMQHVMCCCETGCGMEKVSEKVVQKCGCGHHHDQHVGKNEKPDSHLPSDQHHICFGTHVFFVTADHQGFDAWDSGVVLFVTPAEMLGPEHATFSMPFHEAGFASGRFQTSADLRAHLGVYLI